MGLQPGQVSRIIALGAPVLCVDTCSLLDIVRDPTRDQSQLADFQAAMSLVGHTTGGTLTVLLADQVQVEMNVHLEQVQKECADALLRWTQKIALVESIVSVLGSPPSINTAPLLGHEVRARVQLDALLLAALPAPQSAAIAGRAVARTNRAHTPSGKGKDSTKDCVVIETYLEAMGRLRAAGLTSKCVFLSSNTKDYLDPISRKVKADLGAELGPLGIDYCSAFHPAKHFLGL